MPTEYVPEKPKKLSALPESTHLIRHTRRHATGLKRLHSGNDLCVRVSGSCRVLRRAPIRPAGKTPHPPQTTGIQWDHSRKISVYRAQGSRAAGLEEPACEDFLVAVKMEARFAM